MSIWGPGLYQNDIADDVKILYNDQLHRGKTDEEVLEVVIKDNLAEINDVDDAPLFWLALADTQWKLGRLDEEVKNIALSFIYSGSALSLWENDSKANYKKRQKVLDELKNKLLSPQPPRKNITQYKLYTCQWDIGDVYAYKLESEQAKDLFKGERYILIQKVDEAMWHPGHIIPIVYVKITDSDKLPEKQDDFDKLEFIQTSFTKFENRFYPIDGRNPQADIIKKSKLVYERDEYGFLPEYRVELISTSKRSIPQKLIYLGNFPNIKKPKKEFIPHDKVNIMSLCWSDFERRLLERYKLHNLRKGVMYNG